MDWFLYSWPTLILLGLGLRMALGLTYGARGPEPGDPIFVFLNTTSWVMIALGLLPAVLGGLITVVGGLVAILAASTLLETLLQRRAAQRRSMCTMIALLIERGQQLDSSVLFAGQEMRGIVGRAMEKLFRALGRGAPLMDAVAAYPRALPPEALAYLAAGESRAAQAAGLRELRRSESNELALAWRACIDRLSYLVFILMLMAVVLTFLMTKIMPEFDRIFSDFSMDLPPMTVIAMRSSVTFMQHLAMPIGFGLLVFFVGALVINVCYLMDIPVLRPWSDLLFRGRPSAHVSRILAVAIEQRQPLDRALQQIARFYPSMPMRGRMARAAAVVGTGGDWRDALRDSRVISRAEQALLHTAERAGNLSWALRQIARRREKRTVYRLATALQIIYPAAILLLSAFVGFYVIAIFVPLVKLVEGLT